MALSAHPFHPTTNELLPGYRDAYLRGDLSNKNTALVDAYLTANAAKGDEVFQRFHTLKEKGHQVRPVGWLHHQFELIRTEPARFRRRAGSIILVGALLSGASFAGTRLATAPKSSLPGTLLPVTDEVVAGEAAAGVASEAALAAAKLTLVSGRILDENGHPLIGATILDKASGRGVSTDAKGTYTLAIPANQPAKLQIGYGGYDEEEVQVTGRSVKNVTLVPRQNDQIPAKKRHWWSF